MPGKSNHRVWMTFPLNTSQQTQAFDKNCSMACLCLQRKYVGKPGEHVAKALFQKDRSRKWRIRIPPPGKRTPLGRGTTDARGRMGLDSWILLPKQSFSVFGTQARLQADTPCFVALKLLTKFDTALPVINKSLAYSLSMITLSIYYSKYFTNVNVTLSI